MSTPASLAMRMIEGSSQKLSAGASSSQSAAFGTQTRALMLTVLTNAVHIRTGTNPTATTTDYLLKPSDPSLVLGVGPGDKLALIQETGAGTLYVVELTP
jgi:hypothetical protein